MHLSTRSIRSLRHALIGLGACAALTACGGDDDSSHQPSSGNTTQSGTGGSHVAGPGSGGASATTGNPSGGSGGSGSMQGGSSGNGNSGHSGSGGQSGSGGPSGSGGQSGSGGSGGAADAATPDADTGSTCRACDAGPGPMQVSYSTKECGAIGGIVVNDPGDGSLLRDGCLNGGDELGIIDNSKEPASGIPIEGALCCGCASAGADCDTGLVRCGARSGDTCNDTEFCGYLPGGLCGAADAESVCRTRPMECTTLVQKVCGCDGKEYDNACEANKAGTGINNLGACAH